MLKEFWTIFSLGAPGKRLTVFVAKDSAIFTTTWLTTNNNKFPTFWLFLKYIISCEIKARKQYPLITKRSVNSFRSHIKNSCVVFDRGLQTPRNNKSTRPTVSCFYLFLGVWKPRSNTRTRVRYITWKPFAPSKWKCSSPVLYNVINMEWLQKT